MSVFEETLSGVVAQSTPPILGGPHVLTRFPIETVEYRPLAQPRPQFPRSGVQLAHHHADTAQLGQVLVAGFAFGASRSGALKPGKPTT